MDQIRTRPSTAEYRKGWDFIFAKPASDEEAEEKINCEEKK